MQPGKLGAAGGCFVSGAMLGLLSLSPATWAQAQPVLQTPQQVNDRIRELSAMLRMMPHDYVIGPGDLLDIYVFDVAELSRQVRVSQTGTIGLPLIPVRLHVAGLTELQAGQKVAEVLEANGLVTHADVTISVKEHKSKPITIVGAVPHPMVYEADRSVTLLEALAQAGGVSNDAGDTIIVSRPAQETPADSGEPPEIGPEQSPANKGQMAPQSPPASASASSPKQPTDPQMQPPQTLPSSSGALANSSSSLIQGDPPPLGNIITINLNDLMETGDTKNNIPLQAGDIVTVPHAGIVYVLGAVNRPGGFVLSNDRAQLTTLKILALAGGMTRIAKSDKAVIVRKDNQGQQHEVSVDLKKVLKRRAEDLQLQPSDILYVPESASKQALLRTVELGAALGAGIALYRIAYH